MLLVVVVIVCGFECDCLLVCDRCCFVCYYMMLVLGWWDGFVVVGLIGCFDLMCCLLCCLGLGWFIFWFSCMARFCLGLGLDLLFGVV